MFAPQRSVGWPAVAGLQLGGSVGELVQREPEGSCDAVGDIPGGIGDAALETPDRGGVEIGGVGQCLLGQPDLFSAQTDGAAEGDLGVLADPHTMNPLWQAPR